jgi:L-iditol 2-dehydrogenase
MGSTQDPERGSQSRFGQPGGFEEPMSVPARVAFLHGPHDLRVEHLTISDPGPGQALIRVRAAGICGSDVECFEGNSGEGRYDLAPYTPGHEWAGEVAAVGEGVSEFAVGDKVTGDCVLKCFKCSHCKQGLMPAACLNMREAGFRPDSPGAWGEYLLMEDSYLHKLPNDWTYEDGALVEPFGVGYYGVWGPGGWVDASDDVVIFGAGPIGLSALITCKVAGAKVIVVEPLSNRLEIATALGADVAVQPHKADNLATEINRACGTSRGPTLVVEASGNDDALATLFDVAGFQSRVRLIGHTIGHKVPVEIGKTLWRGMSIYGQGGVSDFTPRAIRFMDRARDSVDFSALISHRVPFEDIHRAVDIAVSRKAEAVKVMMTF